MDNAIILVSIIVGVYFIIEGIRFLFKLLIEVMKVLVPLALISSFSLFYFSATNNQEYGVSNQTMAKGKAEKLFTSTQQLENEAIYNGKVLKINQAPHDIVIVFKSDSEKNEAIQTHE